MCIRDSPRTPSIIHSLGYIRLNPTRQYIISPAVITKKFLKSMLMEFFCLVSPISRNENPRCMKKTRKVQTIIHTLFVVNNSIILNIN